MISPKINQYCTEFSDSIPDYLIEAERTANLRTLAPQMISGPILASFYQWIIEWLQPKNTLEIGTFIGYTALAMAEKIALYGGALHTIEVNPETHFIAQELFKKYAHAHIIKSHLGDAKDIIPTLDNKWDLVLIDAGKKDNLFFFNQIAKLVHSKGLIIIDNTLWKGKVIDEEKDKKTQIIHDLNAHVASLKDFKKLLLPIEDGITLIQRK